MDGGFESKTHLLAILDNMPFMAWYKDNKGIFIAVNKPFADGCGKAKEEIIGKTDFDVWPYELAIKYVNDDLEVMNTQKKKSAEEKINDRSGGTWFETFKSPVFDNDGNVIGTIGMSKDISKSKHFQLELENQKNIEKELKESELRLNLATGSAMIGLWDWNLQTGTTIYNEQWANIIGYSLNELQPIGIQTWIKNTHPDDLEKSNDLLLKHFNGEIEYYENEIRLRHKNGQWIWVLDRGKVIEWDSQQNPIRMVGTHIDITERKLIEEELKRKEKILSAAAYSIKELLDNRDYLDALSKCFELIGTATQLSRIYLFVNTYDDDGIYTSEKLEWSSGAYKTKLNNSKLENIPFEDLDDFISILKNNKPFHGVTKKLDKCKFKDLLESRDTLSFIIFPIFVERVFWGFIGLDECKYERNWTESEFSTLSAFTTSIGKTIERDLIEKTLETSRQNAEKANMLKSQFLANMSHEIRTPMHAILGYTSLLKDIVENDESLNYLNSIQKAGNMLMNLITDILDLSKIEAGKLELQTGYVDIRRLFDDIKEIFSLKIEAQHPKLCLT